MADTLSITQHDRTAWPTYIWIWVAVAAVQSAILAAMGQPFICTCGVVRLWHGTVSDAGNSQHLSDWYTFSHIIHGFGFYFLLWLAAPRISLIHRFAMALLLEAGWEIFENTPLIIERYRQGAMAQGYFGDSIINSVADAFAAALGFILARVLPRSATIALLVAMELGVGYAIRDNLLLNIVQLAYPSEMLSRWQAR
ncbi:MAG TPA: DUF2585 family protein [Xanthobacteraceae bacterium]|nr:DUF2585 family protein [Xanthobacteraceae bacterium]